MKSNPSWHRLFWIKFRTTFLPVALSVLFLGSVSIAVQTRSTVHQIEESSSNILRQTIYNVDLMFSGLDTISLAINQETGTMERLQSALDSNAMKNISTLREIDSFSRYVSNLANSNPYIFSVYVYVNNENRFFINSLEGRFSSLDTFYDTAWYESYLDNRARADNWTEARSVHRYAFERPVELISRYRRVYPIGMATVGVIVENVEAKRILDLIRSVQLMDGQKVLVWDERGQPLLHYPAAEPANFDVPPDSRSSLHFSLTSQQSGWTYTTLVPYSSVLASLRGLLSTFALTLCVGLVFSAIVSMLFARQKFQRIRAVMQAFDSPKPQRVDFPKKSMDEYDYFWQNSFNEYIERTNLKMMISTQKYQLRITEMIALQSQINPHFLFNTLETIKWESIGLTHSENEVSRMLENLAEIMRYAFSNPDDTVTLQEELRVTSCYIQILQMRYAKKFEVQLHCHPSLLDQRVPKLLLQPLIENSIYHGAKEKEGFCTIRVTIRPWKEGACIQIIDNGGGMDRERLLEVRRGLQSEIPLGSVGLYNVYKRLKIASGDHCQIRVLSRQNAGTSISIYFTKFEGPNILTALSEDSPSARSESASAEKLL